MWSDSYIESSQLKDTVNLKFSLQRGSKCAHNLKFEPRFDPGAVRLSVNKDANSVHFHCCVYLWLSLESASVQQQLPVLEVIKVYGKLAGLRLARRVK